MRPRRLDRPARLRSLDAGLHEPDHRRADDREHDHTGAFDHHDHADELSRSSPVAQPINPYDAGDAINPINPGHPINPGNPDGTDRAPDR